MASLGIGKAFRSAWHSLTSYDRHSDFDSPYRTGQHVRLSQSRHDPLTSVATDGSESRADVSSPYLDDHSHNSTSALNGNAFPVSPVYPPTHGATSPSPYSPGMRSSSAQKQHDHFAENAGRGEIQMQAFQEGLPPPPPVAHSWRRIDKWTEEHYEELFEELGEGCTTNDLNDLEHQLDCSLPMDVRESLQCHDGQEVGGRPTGMIFGCMLLDCEEIVHEWRNWKTVNEEFLSSPPTHKSSAPVKGSSSASSSSKAQQSQNPMWRQDLLAKQDSQPPGAIQKVYAHPRWIPLVRDWGGNNLAVDLAPGPTGKWGQVILFGRDYDCKYVVSRSWASFLATVADDLNSGKWFIDEDTNELKLREFKTSHVEPAYLDILRWRSDQKYGRRGPRRRPQSTARPISSPTGSPYDSPSAEMGEPRGRSMQRFSGASPVSSPNRPNYPKSSPLSKVAEETPASQSTSQPQGLAIIDTSNANKKLVEIETPRVSDEQKHAKVMESLLEPPSSTTDGKENAKVVDTANGEPKMNGNATKQPTVEDENVMKTIEI